MVTKGASGGTLFFNTDDAFQAHAALEGKGVELAEEPTEQSYGTDFGLRDPFGNIRFAQRSIPTPKPTPEARGDGPPKHCNASAPDDSTASTPGFEDLFAGPLPPVRNTRPGSAWRAWADAITRELAATADVSQ